METTGASSIAHFFRTLAVTTSHPIAFLKSSLEMMSETSYRVIRISSVLWGKDAGALQMKRVMELEENFGAKHDIFFSRCQNFSLSEKKRD